MPERRFSLPWSAELQPNHYVVRDANKQQLAYVYYENEPGRRSAAKLLSKDVARRIAANIAKSPELLRRTILDRVGPATPLRIEFANRVNYVVRVRPR